MARMSAEERRESVIRAATTEFARGGYHGTSTEAIARRVGVSQPYLFRLFPGKKAIFLAAAERCVEDTIRTFAEAAEGLEGDEALHAMGGAYIKTISEQPERLMMQMQMYLAVAAAEEEGDHEFGEAVRAGWMRLWDTVRWGPTPTGRRPSWRRECSSTASWPWASRPAIGSGRGWIRPRPAADKKGQDVAPFHDRES
jgi:AcrR family transcriptional regulator